MKHRLPHKAAPCKNCPFRKDSLKGWLGEDRTKEILRAGAFVCHKTIRGRKSDRLQCAGHMLLMESDNEFVRLADRMGIDLNISGREIVFDTPTDCINHHK